MKRTLLAFSVLALPTTTFADLGIGASFKSSEAGIYLPVTITPRIFVEPYLRYSDRDSELSVADSSEPGVDSSSSTLSVGAGLFGVSKIGDAVDFYYGARVAYLRQESSSAVLIISPISPPSLEVPTQETDTEGFSIAPTLGFQYFLTDRLSLGAEVRWEFTELSGTITTNSIAVTETRIDHTSRQNDTRTDVLLRFYFN